MAISLNCSCITSVVGLALQNELARDFDGAEGMSLVF